MVTENCTVITEDCAVITENCTVITENCTVITENRTVNCTVITKKLIGLLFPSLICSEFYDVHVITIEITIVAGKRVYN